MTQRTIVHHEDWSPGVQYTHNGPIVSSYTEMHRALYVKRRGKEPPSGALNQVFAYINQGRWVVECPADGCGGAVMASMEVREFYCSICGSEENGGYGYEVVFPEEWEAIERELMKRPAAHPFHAAPHRNWVPGETVRDLKRETRAHRGDES